MDLEEYIIQVVKGDKTGLVAKIVLILLTGLSFLYGLVIRFREKLYHWGLKKSKDLDATVISVGNITVGGTGKTPFVELLAKTLTQAGYQVVILNRGYKGKFEGKIGVVSNGEEILMSAQEAGDEAYMLATRLPQIPVVVGSERSKTGDYACQEFEPDFIILDDGFQHWQVARDYDFVVIDATNPFDNGYLLPRGRLREPISRLDRGDIFILTKVDQITATKLKKIKKRLIKINPAATIITTKHAPTYLRKLVSQDQKEPKLEGQEVLAVSGIGNPQAFEQTLEDLGARVVDKIRYRDHHDYSKEEIVEIFTNASHKGVDKIITTEKDAVSINQDLVAEIGQEKIDFEVLGIEMEILDSKTKFEDVISKLEVSGCE